MPIYEYRCTDCTDFEQVHGMGRAPDVVDCPTCQSPARRQMSAPTLSVAGSAAYRVLEETARSAFEPTVVRSTHPGTPSGAGRQITHNPLHRNLPRP